MVKVSAIVPVYNVEKYLKECVDSLLSQTLEDIEIILVDDGSTDGSSQICDEYALKDPRIKVIHQKNTGLSGARLSGLKVCTGEYITHIDSDDFVNRDYLYGLYSFAVENSLDISIAQIKFFNQDSIRDAGVFKGKKIHTELPEKLSLIRNEENKYWTSVVNKLFSRKLINLLDEYPNPEDLSTGEDCLCMIKAIYFSEKIGSNDESIYYYRYNPNSLTHTISEKNLKDKDTTTKEIINFMNKMNFPLECVQIVMDNCVWHNLFTNEQFFHYMQYSNYKKYFKKSLLNINYIKTLIKTIYLFLIYKLTFDSKRSKRKERYVNYKKT